jgi:hypothetical protein
MIDHINTYKKINVHYLTWTFISRSNLSQTSLNMTKPAHSDLRTLYVLVIATEILYVISRQSTVRITVQIIYKNIIYKTMFIYIYMYILLTYLYIIDTP